MKILLFISVLMVLPSTSWACGWALISAQVDITLDLQDYKRALEKIKPEFPKGWTLSQSFDTAKECQEAKIQVENRISESIDEDKKKHQLSSSEIERGTNSIINIVFDLSCIPFPYFLKLAE